MVYHRWLRPQLNRGMGAVTSLASVADYFVSNLKMILRRGEQTIPGAVVTYDPPGNLEDLPKYRTQEHDGRILELVAMSRGLLDPGGRWGPAYHFTGFWAAGTGHAPPPAHLVEFLQAGPAPVVLTMGSMVMFDPERLARDFGEALRRIGRRGVIVRGWARWPDDTPGDGTVLYLDEAPYDWLFPRASCVVHHGGCGTVAAVLRAGKPSVILPQVMCQEQFAELLTREGLATGVFGTLPLDPGALASALRRAVLDGPPNRRAEEWRELVTAEGGVAAAADLIESHRANLR